MVTMEPGEAQAAVSASSPSSVRMWQACRTILRASDRAARFGQSSHRGDHSIIVMCAGLSLSLAVRQREGLRIEPGRQA
jgi:hypothetical protein